MRLYAGKVLAGAVNRQIEQRTESRDAILWDVLTNERVARVKIQGSSTLIVAHYPENWESTPVWLKPGNSVRISHTGGLRGRIELIGHGALIPSAVAGDDNTITNSYPDALISGMGLTPGGGMDVAVAAGSVRFSGVTSATSPATKTIGTAPSAGLSRYDLIVVGSNLVIDVVAGTAAATPAKPAVPTGHILVGWVLVASGCTTITEANINRTFSPLTPSSLVVTPSDGDLAWAETTSTVTVYVKDQFGNALSGSYTVTLAFISGNGTISNGGNNSTTSLAVAFSASSVAYTYTREGNDPGDSSPTLQATITGYNAIGATMILLRNAGGDVMF